MQIIALLNACSETFKEFPKNEYNTVIRAITSSPVLACQWAVLTTKGSNQTLLSPVPVERQNSFEYDCVQYASSPGDRFLSSQGSVEAIGVESATGNSKSVSIYVHVYVCMLSVCVYTHTHIYIFMYIYTHTIAYTTHTQRIYVYIYTHTHNNIHNAGT
jgi:hypothetical protein